MKIFSHKTPKIFQHSIKLTIWHIKSCEYFSLQLIVSLVILLKKISFYLYFRLHDLFNFVLKKIDLDDIHIFCFLKIFLLSFKYIDVYKFWSLSSWYVSQKYLWYDMFLSGSNFWTLGKKTQISNKSDSYNGIIVICNTR